MKTISVKKAKPSRSTTKMKDLSPRKDVRGGGSVDKIAINHNEVVVAEGLDRLIRQKRAAAEYEHCGPRSRGFEEAS